MLVSFDFRGKLTSVEELQNWLANQNNKWYSISYTVRDEEVSVILQPIEKCGEIMFVDQVKIYVKAATVVTEWLRIVVRSMYQKAQQVATVVKVQMLFYC